MITYSKSFIDFLRNSDCKIAKVLFNAWYLEHKAYDLMLTTDEINYITFRTDGTISYLPAGKEHKVNDNGDWSREGRQNGKPAKVIRKLFTKKALRLFKDADFECISNHYKAKFGANGLKFEIREARHIPDVYCMQKCEGDGSLQNSCMNGDRSYLDIYKHCEQLRIVVLLDKDNLLAGRALLWQIGEITFIDRFYVTHDWQYDLFVEYAKTNGFWYKRNYKFYSDKKDFITPAGESVHRQFTIYTDTDFDEYPYIDTFSYGGDGYLTNESDEYEYNNTDGTRDGSNNTIYDAIGERDIDEGDAIMIDSGEYSGEYTHESNVVLVNGYYYWINSNEIARLNGEWYLKEDVVYSEYDNEDYLLDDCVYSEHHESYILSYDAIEIENEYYHKDCEDIVEIDNTWYLKTSEEIIEIDGEWYLREDVENENQLSLF